MSELLYGYGTTVEERYIRIYWPLRRRVKLWVVLIPVSGAVTFAIAAFCAWIDS